MDLPDKTTDRLQTAREDLVQAEKRWQDLIQTACEVAGIDPSNAQIDVQHGRIKSQDTDEDTEQ